MVGAPAFFDGGGVLFVVDHLLLLAAAFPLLLPLDLCGCLIFCGFDLKDGRFDFFNELFSGVIAV